MVVIKSAGGSTVTLICTSRMQQSVTEGVLQFNTTLTIFSPLEVLLTFFKQLNKFAGFHKRLYLSCICLNKLQFLYTNLLQIQKLHILKLSSYILSLDAEEHTLKLEDHLIIVLFHYFWNLQPRLMTWKQLNVWIFFLCVRLTWNWSGEKKSIKRVIWCFFFFFFLCVCMCKGVGQSRTKSRVNLLSQVTALAFQAPEL